jgi:hypothetical protein
MAKAKLFKGSEQITIVLGSGFHLNVLCDKKSSLTNWAALLRGISGSKFKTTGNYILDFEAIVLNKTKSQNKVAAYKIEKELLKSAAKNLEIEQKRAIKKHSKNYPLFLFNPKLVSDVISLNFDLVPELLLTNNHVPKVKQKNNGINYLKDSNSCRYREINKIRFWHPHGDIKKPGSMLLGHRKYALHLADLEKMRMHNKAPKIKSTPQTWYDTLLSNTVLVIGASLSHAELDLWTALVNRERNFAKVENHKQHRRPIYIMTDTNDYSNLSSWLKPIFNTNYCYEKQWKLLEKMFNKQSNNTIR